MARYGINPQQTLVNMHTPINTEFYQNLLGKAQQDLTQASGIQAKFLEDVYGQKYLDEATRAREVAKAEQMVAGVLDKDFVSPSQTIKTVSKASQALAPWRNLNERQLELAKEAEAFKLQHGANALMTDPTKVSLTNPDGSLKSPEQLKFTGLNAEDIDKIFLTSEKGALTSKYDKRVKSDIPYKIKIQTVEGLSPEEIQSKYGNDSEEAVRLAEQQIQATPQILDIFEGNKSKAIEYLKNRNLATAGQFGQSSTSKYIDDDWSLYMAKQRQENVARTVAPNVPFYPVDGMIKPAEGKNLSSQIAKATGGKQEINWDNLPFNAQGNLIAAIPGKMEYARDEQGQLIPTKRTQSQVTPQYKEAANQLFTLKQSLVKQGIIPSYTSISDKDAIEMLKKAVDNSVVAYGLQNESVGDMFEGDNFDAFTDSKGNFKAATNAELEYFDKEKGKWVQSTLKDLSEELGWEGASSTSDKNLTAQLSKGTSKELEYSSGKPMSVRTVLDPQGNPVTVRSRLGNKAAETYGKPYAQAQNMLTEPGKHTLEFNGLNINVEVQPSIVTSPNGEFQLVNRIVDLDFTGATDNEFNAQAIQTILSSHSPEKALIDFTRNYRDNMYENKQIIKKVESTKK